MFWRRYTTTLSEFYPETPRMPFAWLLDFDCLLENLFLSRSATRPVRLALECVDRPSDAVRYIARRTSTAITPRNTTSYNCKAAVEIWDALRHILALDQVRRLLPSCALSSGSGWKAASDVRWCETYETIWGASVKDCAYGLLALASTRQK